MSNDYFWHSVPEAWQPKNSPRFADPRGKLRAKVKSWKARDTRSVSSRERIFRRDVRKSPLRSSILDAIEIINSPTVVGDQTRRRLDIGNSDLQLDFDPWGDEIVEVERDTHCTSPRLTVENKLCDNKKDLQNQKLDCSLKKVVSHQNNVPLQEALEKTEPKIVLPKKEERKPPEAAKQTSRRFAERQINLTRPVKPIHLPKRRRAAGFGRTWKPVESRRQEKAIEVVRPISRPIVVQYAAQRIVCSSELESAEEKKYDATDEEVEEIEDEVEETLTVDNTAVNSIIGAGKENLMSCGSQNSFKGSQKCVMRSQSSPVILAPTPTKQPQPLRSNKKMRTAQCSPVLLPRPKQIKISPTKHTKVKPCVPKCIVPMQSVRIEGLKLDSTKRARSPPKHPKRKDKPKPISFVKLESPELQAHHSATSNSPRSILSIGGTDMVVVPSPTVEVLNKSPAAETKPCINKPPIWHITPENDASNLMIVKTENSDSLQIIAQPKPKPIPKPILKPTPKTKTSVQFKKTLIDGALGDRISTKRNHFQKLKVSRWKEVPNSINSKGFWSRTINIETNRVFGFLASKFFFRIMFLLCWVICMILGWLMSWSVDKITRMFQLDIYELLLSTFNSFDRFSNDKMKRFQQ